MMVGGNEPGPWGPASTGGRRFRVLRRVVASIAVLGLVGTAAALTTATVLADQIDTNLQRVPVPELEAAPPRTDARHFLVVGSDARDGLSAEDRANLSLGTFDGQRSDTIIYVSISADRSAVSLVSLPRDLLVVDGERTRKLTDVYAGGPDELVRVIRENFGLPVNHYVAVSLASFVDVVRTLGGVEICLDEPLVDPKSGADFEPGCQEMDAADSLAYVRSRVGPRADLDRIDRQQDFIRSVLGELTSTRVLANPVQLSRLIEDVAPNVTTDDALGLRQMLSLGDELRGVVGAGIPMTAVPSYPRTINGGAYMIAYAPGARAMFQDLREGRPLAHRGSKAEREETVVAIVSGGRESAGRIVGPTLRFAGFLNTGPWSGPSEIHADAFTTVYAVPGNEERAAWVAAVLGAPVEQLPPEVTPPQGAMVVVSVGDDAEG
jgi:LCP family protein required for cell wall assembly